ncbi:MAG TPA: hypothetical protein VG937_05470 [Polyangiaceae bacterium]|nr:hypothetical protein [Polyangiaceae bacterium]
MSTHTPSPQRESNASNFESYHSDRPESLHSDPCDSFHSDPCDSFHPDVGSGRVTRLTPGASTRLAHLSDGELLSRTQDLVGKSNQVLAALLDHLAEVEARGLHRQRACSSLYTYCIYELRFSEDAAARRSSAARLARRFPAILRAVATGELHLTGLLMLGPHLTEANHLALLALAKFRTKKELSKLIRRLAPLPSVPDRMELIGVLPPSRPAPTWAKFIESLSPPVRELPARTPSVNHADDSMSLGDSDRSLDAEKIDDSDRPGGDSTALARCESEVRWVDDSIDRSAATGVAVGERIDPSVQRRSDGTALARRESEVRSVDDSIDRSAATGVAVGERIDPSVQRRSGSTALARCESEVRWVDDSIDRSDSTGVAVGERIDPSDQRRSDSAALARCESEVRWVDDSIDRGDATGVSGGERIDRSDPHGGNSAKAAQCEEMREEYQSTHRDDAVNSRIVGKSSLPDQCGRESVAPTPPESEGPSWCEDARLYLIQFTTTEEHAELVERARALLSHSLPKASLGELHLRAVRLLVRSLERKRFGAQEAVELHVGRRPRKRPDSLADAAGTLRRGYGAPCTSATGSAVRTSTNVARAAAKRTDWKFTTYKLSLSVANTTFRI